MNVLALLENELKGKNWTIDEKMRYLYLRSCELFSYDPRFFLCNALPNGKEIQKEIREKKIDLEHVDSRWVICSSYANYVYSTLLKELLNKDSIVTGIGHEYVVLEDSNKRKIVADATHGYDFTRVKMGLTTYGYYPLRHITREFGQEIEQMDKKIGYLKEEYNDNKIKREANKLICKKDIYSPKELLLKRLQEVERLYHSYQNIEEFSDLENCLFYLQKHILLEDYEKITEIPLFQVTDNNSWHFMKIFSVKIENSNKDYALAKEDDVYSYKEISQEQVKYFQKKMTGK